MEIFEKDNKESAISKLEEALFQVMNLSDMVEISYADKCKFEERRMIIYKGKAKDMTKEAILKAWLKATRPIERLEPEDFSKN